MAGARRVAVQMANSVGFRDLDSSNIAIVATELANNLVNHAKNGELIISADQPAGKDFSAICRIALREPLQNDAGIDRGSAGHH